MMIKCSKVCVGGNIEKKAQIIIIIKKSNS